MYQGRAFVNELMKELYVITKTRHRISSAYHSQVSIQNVKMHIRLECPWEREEG